MKKIITICLISFVIAACKKEESKENTPQPQPQLVNTVPEFFREAYEADYGKTAPDYVLIAGTAAKISIPQDLDFNPKKPEQLWIVNKGTEMTGGTTVTIEKPGEPDQKVLFKKDGNSWHFMSMPSAISFSENGNWATSPNVLDANHSGGMFTGPTLWSSDLSIYAVIGNPPNRIENGSHLDMIHETPYGMGITIEKDNAFWIFDGYWGNIARYDFVDDHGPGNSDHSDGRVKRYSEVKVKRDANVPSHLILDANKKWLYIVDGGNKRILRMDITSGAVASGLPPMGEPLAEYVRMSGVTWEVLFDQNLTQPCGIDIRDNRLFVSDYGTGEIICYDVSSKKELARVNTGRKGITGIKLNGGKIWYVNALDHTLSTVNPK